jgi:hypothetical protein
LKKYLRADKWKDYFGQTERNDIGPDITKLCKGWIISDSGRDVGRPFSTGNVAKLIVEDFNSKYAHIKCEVDMHMVLRALAGMCFNDEACEVADGLYYVGSIADWRADEAAHEELERLLPV